MRYYFVFTFFISLLYAVSSISPIDSIGRKTRAVILGSKSLSIPDSMKDGIASGLAAAVAKAILQPFDTIKTVQQMQGSDQGLFQTFSKFIQERGFLELWSGLGVSVIGSCPSTALYFGTYSTTKKALIPIFPANMRLVVIGISAVVGNSLASCLRVPYELYKQRLQCGQHKDIMEAISYTINVEGISGMFTSGKLSSQILRDVPYAVVTIVAYDILQSVVQKLASDGRLTLTRNRKIYDGLCGSVAGGLGAYATMPMDVVKTRLMSSDNTHRSFTEAFVHIASKEGVDKLFAGSSSRLLHKIPANGLFFLFYEVFRTGLGVKDARQSSK